MSIKTTHDIDRATALSVIMSKIHSCTNDELEDVLECFEESYYRNYIVHDNLPDEPESSFVIRNVREFNKSF